MNFREPNSTTTKVPNTIIVNIIFAFHTGYYIKLDPKSQ